MRQVPLPPNCSYESYLTPGQVLLVALDSMMHWKLADYRNVNGN